MERGAIIQSEVANMEHERRLDMYKQIKTKCYSAMANEVNKYKKQGYGITYKVDGKEYVLRKGIRQVVRITKEA